MDEIVKIELFGEEFKFKPDAAQKINPQDVATHVKGYIEDAESVFQNKTSGKNKLAILLLAAMNLSKDFKELKLRYADLEDEVERRISSLLKKIDEGIK